MKTSSFLKILMLALATLVACQVGFAQVTPHAVVPAGTVPAGHARPHIWFSGRSAAMTTPSNVTPNVTYPTICTASGHYYEFCPNNFQTIYGVNSIVSGNGGSGMTIAIVDAYHYSAVAADLLTFTNFFQQPSCTIGNGCLAIEHCTGTSGTPP